MRSTDSTFTESAKRLAATATPIYLVDDRRRIVFCNTACAAWAEVEAPALVGRECRYHSQPAAERADTVAAAFCPPPEVFAGQRMRVALTLPSASGAVRRREAEFVPLAGAGDEIETVLVLLDMVDVAAPASGTAVTSLDDPGTLHAALARVHAELTSYYQPRSLVGESPGMRRAGPRSRWRHKAA